MIMGQIAQFGFGLVKLANGLQRAFVVNDRQSLQLAKHRFKGLELTIESCRRNASIEPRAAILGKIRNA
ncbi:hypothetical protein AYM39_21415 [Methylomonas sp. DH-1]|nr:hypothetical protein AYM39_21415 [Methylomonas sp. DH-1]